VACGIISIGVQILGVKAAPNDDQAIEMMPMASH
jgi:hypothetical protein